MTAFYELVSPGKEGDLPKVDPLKYQLAAATVETAGANEVLTVKVRYKQPHAEASELVSVPTSDPGKTVQEASAEFRFAAAVACWGMLLRGSEHKGVATHGMVLELAAGRQGRRPKRLSRGVHSLGRVEQGRSRPPVETLAVVRTENGTGPILAIEVSRHGPL